MKGDSFKNCRICGRPVGIITRGIYRKILVDADAVMVVPDRFGDEYLRVDGTKMRGAEVGITSENAEPVYRPHRCAT